MFVAEFREDIRVTIPVIAKGLKDSHSDVRKAAIEGVSRLAVQGVCLNHSPVGVLKHNCS